MASDTVVLTAPLPTDKAECRAVLDAACLALWGGKEWERLKPRQKRDIAPHLRPRVAPVPAEWSL